MGDEEDIMGINLLLYGSTESQTWSGKLSYQ